MKIKHIIFLALSTSVITGCQSIIDFNNKMNHKAMVNYNKQAAGKSSSVKKCWTNLHKVQTKIQKSPGRASQYLASMNKMLNDYNYGSGCMHVPGYPQALQYTFQHTQQVAANYVRQNSYRGQYSY